MIKESVPRGGKNYDAWDLSNDQIEAVNMLEEAGLDFVSSPAQIKHGTLMFKDPMLPGVGYSITKTGYARRHVEGDPRFRDPRSP